jgi:biotin synthase-related radical SAM superfamily protein
MIEKIRWMISQAQISIGTAWSVQTVVPTLGVLCVLSLILKLGESWKDVMSVIKELRRYGTERILKHPQP